MARRFTTNVRDDRVRSNRDYQEILRREAAAIECGSRRSRIGFASIANDGANIAYGGIGFYHKAKGSGALSVTVEADTDRHVYEVPTTSTWSRWGHAFPFAGEVLQVEILPSPSVRELHLWGVSGGRLTLPDKVLEAATGDATALSSRHLAPESLYFDHDETWTLKPDQGRWRDAQLVYTQPIINVKKCAYCQRYLPLDPGRPSALAFHKHNAKLSGHQNECRACKKWRINDHLNVLRTVDQLHESSTITRERKLLLKEPEILKAIKEREGAGLKSIIWKRFQKTCFKCGKKLKLREVELDHTRPLAYLWPIDIHATCLCEICNNNKGDRFPADFYSHEEIKRLARVTGLSARELNRRAVNTREVNRIRRQISEFALAWDARTLNAIARKVSELRPDIDLWEDLRRADPELHATLQRKLSARS